MSGDTPMVYLDHNAGTPVRPEVLEAMARASAELPGNPSSVHAAGRRARAALEQARAQVAAFLGALPEEIVFTSGGTEANNLAIGGLVAAAAGRGRQRIVSSPLEHPSVRGMVEALVGVGGPATSNFVAVTPTGDITVEALEAAVGDDADCGVVTLALANHELGNVYPIARLAGVAHARGALFHTDAVQAAGKIPVDIGALGVDAATVSAHKLGGPKGVGAVFIRRGLDLPPRLTGGHQERERRPGTENLVGAIGFGVACTVAAAALAEEARRFQSMRRTLVAGLMRIPGAVLFGRAAEKEGEGVRAVDREEAGAQFLPGTTMVAFPEAPGQLVVIGLDLEGICVSIGAACSSGSLEPSPVLLGLGLGRDAAAEGVRISFGWTTTAEEVERLCALLPAIVARVRGAVAAPAPAAARREVHG